MLLKTITVAAAGASYSSTNPHPPATAPLNTLQAPDSDLQPPYSRKVGSPYLTVTQLEICPTPQPFSQSPLQCEDNNSAENIPYEQPTANKDKLPVTHSYLNAVYVFCAAEVTLGCSLIAKVIFDRCHHQPIPQPPPNTMPSLH